MCACLDTHYLAGLVCPERAPPGEPCADLGQCVQDAECDLVGPHGGMCRCDPGFYKDGDGCLPLIDAGEDCEIDHSCVANAHCAAIQGGKVRISLVYFSFYFFIQLMCVFGGSRYC